MKKYFVLALVAILALILVATASANGATTCPEGPANVGGEDGVWTKIDSDDLSLHPVDGATYYCFKLGTEKSEGCEGGVFRELPIGDEYCGLSHWSYFVPNPVGEQCGRCSTVADFTWVEWFDRDGGCDDDYYNERVVTYPSTECGAIFGCMEREALNFDPDANFPDRSCYYECDFTHEVEGLSSPGPWDEWTFDGEVFNRCRLVKTAVQHRDDTTDFLCELESRESEVCETQPDACPNLEGGQFEVPDGYIKPGRRCVPKPFNLKEVSVGVGASCGRSVDGIVYQLQGGVAIDPSGGATLTLDGVDYTASSPWWGGFGTHNWSAVATEGYVIVTADAGSFEINNSDCNESPEDTPETGGGSEIGIVLAGSMTLAGIGFAILGAREWAKEKKEKKG